MSFQQIRDARAFPIVVVGHVDHGKSTLVGRVLYDTDSLPEDKVRQLAAVSGKRGLELEWSFLLDALQLERDQGITVDTTQIWFRSAKRRYVVIDAPGHQEFLKNMVTGAAQADAAVLVVDAAQGLAEQTRRHAYLLHLLGIDQVVVAINKIDLVGHDQARFDAVAAAVADYLSGLGLRAVASVPVSARHGDNIVAVSPATPWYQGPALLEALDQLEARASLRDLPLRLPVQDVYRRGDERIIVGRIESGQLAVGDEVTFAPSRQRARVVALERWERDRPRQSAAAGESVAIRLDADLFVERGMLAAHPASPAMPVRTLSVRLFWLDRRELATGDRLRLRLGTADVEARIDAIPEVLDVETLAPAARKVVAQNDVARARLSLVRPVALDRFNDIGATGRGVLVRDHRLVGGFIVERIDEALDVTQVDLPVDRAERVRLNGHKGGVLWLTGLSGAGKSTLATALLRRLTDHGVQATVIDGDNLRLGLSRDLGFSDADRSENIRRAAEVAKLFAESGMVAIVSLISPFAADRAVARDLIGADFHEVFVKASLETCAARDPKGLYAKARQGAIAGFTGLGGRYEAPVAADLVIDSDSLDRTSATEKLVAYAEQAFRPVAGQHGDGI